MVSLLYHLLSLYALPSTFTVPVTTGMVPSTIVLKASVLLVRPTASVATAVKLHSPSESPLRFKVIVAVCVDSFAVL